MKQHVHFSSLNWGGRCLNLGLLLALLALCVLAAPAPAAMSNVQPMLLQMAAERPDEPVAIVVQKTGDAASVEDWVANLGGVVTKDLHIINAFAARLPAGAVPELATAPGVRWVSLDAPVFQAGAPGKESVTLRDAFDAISYANSDGTARWAGGWAEIGESDGPELGDVRIATFLGGSRRGLRIQNSSRGVSRAVDLSAAEGAVLSFEYRRKGFDKADYVAVEISVDAGASWKELGRVTGPATDPSVLSASYDLSDYATAQTRIRFVSSPAQSSEGRLYLDSVQIKYRRSGVTDKNLDAPLMMPAPTTAAQTFRDEFNARVYNGSNGTQDWSGTSWTEIDEPNGPGPSDGPVQVSPNSTNCLSPNCLRVGGTKPQNPDPGFGVFRQVNLSGASTATLTFSYRRGTYGSPHPTAGTLTLDVSPDGGATWITVRTYHFDGVDAAQTAESVDISSFIASNTQLRFLTHGPVDDIVFFIDNIQIELDGSPPGGGGAGAGGTVRDEFSTRSFNNNDGSASWSTDWVEVNDDNKPDKGEIRIESHDDCPVRGNSCLRVKAKARSGDYIWREADLSGATSAALTYDYKNKLAGNAQVEVQASGDGGSNWTSLRTYTSQSGSGSEAVDLTSFISANTRIRIYVAQRDDKEIRIDNIQIEYSCPECVDTSNLESVFVRTIGADQLWTAPPYLQGQGIVVAVVDSGVAAHDDLMDSAGNSRVGAHEDFTGSHDLPDDYYGHGTHVAGTIGGNGFRSGHRYAGVAPKANLIDVKVTDDQGAGTTSDVVAGLQWVYENKDVYNIRVVNLSLNSSVAESYHTSPLDAAVEVLWFNGVVVVVSAGNNGGGADNGILYPPANDPFVITVGAADDRGTADVGDDIPADFSAYGTTQNGFAKPDIIAPGMDIISLLASDDCNLNLEHPDHAVGGPAGNYYFRMSGTSMSSAVTAGAVALLLQDEPALNPDQVKYRLMATARPFRVAGYLDISAAVHGDTRETANTGIEVSQLLWTGSDPPAWNSVNWSSVNWSSVNWSSVNWSSVNWSSVNWSSVYWGN